MAVEEQLRRVGEHLLGQPAELLRLLHLEGLIRKVWASERMVLWNRRRMAASWEVVVVV